MRRKGKKNGNLVSNILSHIPYSIVLNLFNHPDTMNQLRDVLEGGKGPFSREIFRLKENIISLMQKAVSFRDTKAECNSLIQKVVWLFR